MPWSAQTRRAATSSALDSGGWLRPAPGSHAQSTRGVGGHVVDDLSACAPVAVACRVFQLAADIARVEPLPVHAGGRQVPVLGARNTPVGRVAGLVAGHTVLARGAFAVWPAHHVLGVPDTQIRLAGCFGLMAVQATRMHQNTRHGGEQGCWRRGFGGLGLRGTQSKWAQYRRCNAPEPGNIQSHGGLAVSLRWVDGRAGRRYTKAMCFFSGNSRMR